MRDEKLRKIKEVKGWKVNHPFETGNIIFTVLIFVMTSISLMVLFLPLITYKNHTNLSFNGLDLIKFFFVNQMNITNDAMSKLGTIGTSNVQIQGIVAYMLMGQSIFVAIILLVCSISLIYFIVSLFKGYLRKAKFVRTLAIIELVLVLIFSLSFVAYDILDMNYNHGNNQIIYVSALIPAGVMVVLLIAVSINYHLTYKDVVYEKDLRIRTKPNNEETIDVKEEDNFEGEEIPQDITSIGGHAFAENQNLKVANIPEGISKLGPGAFANCLHLKIVNIPSTVDNIGFNCFFHCVELEQVNYAGSKAQWRDVKRGSNWLAQTKVEKVNCLDGEVVINPFN